MYGYDCGKPDYDLPRNRDYEALSTTPEAIYEDVRIDSPAMLTPPITTAAQPQHAHSASRDDSYYYSKPVPVTFPRDLQPLPQCVVENPMNLLYFHYFVDYTSKILVTHDCSSNPFRTILPKLALGDDNLLSLILAYGACHRARVLKHSEPINRIAQWVTRLFPTFRQALASGRPISETLFGTCVMLASLTQSYPYAFDIGIPWPAHLSMAREMCRSVTTRVDRPRSTAAYFFLRWFGYLDTFGSCSADVYQGDYDIWSRDLLAVENDVSFRCLTGYTTRSLVLLSRAAALAKRCDEERSTTGQLSLEPVLLSQYLRCNLELGSLEVACQSYDCSCISTTTSTNTFRAVNGALIHTALIVLHRRVYSLPSQSLLVQASVTGILSWLSRYEAETPIDIPDIILPLFLAGCEAQQLGQRQEVLKRLQRIGDAGMSQVERVRGVLHEIWETGQDWIDVKHGVLLG